MSLLVDFWKDVRLERKAEDYLLDSRRDDPCRRCRYWNEWAGCTAIECWRDVREPKPEVDSK